MVIRGNMVEDNDALLEAIYEELLEEGYCDCEDTAERAFLILNDRAK